MGRLSLVRRRGIGVEKEDPTNIKEKTGFVKGGVFLEIQKETEGSQEGQSSDTNPKRGVFAC